MNRNLLKSLGRHLLGAALTAAAGIQWFDADVKVGLAAVAAACVPVLLKYLDASDPDFGKGSI